jgi:hypothetical protein
LYFELEKGDIKVRQPRRGHNQIKPITPGENLVDSADVGEVKEHGNFRKGIQKERSPAKTRTLKSITTASSRVSF